MAYEAVGNKGVKNRMKKAEKTNITRNRESNPE